MSCSEATWAMSSCNLSKCSWRFFRVEDFSYKTRTIEIVDFLWRLYISCGKLPSSTTAGCMYGKNPSTTFNDDDDEGPGGRLQINPSSAPLDKLVCCNWQNDFVQDYRPLGRLGQETPKGKILRRDTNLEGMQWYTPEFWHTKKEIRIDR